MGVAQADIEMDGIVAHPDIMSSKGDDYAGGASGVIVELKDTVNGRRLDFYDNTFRSYLRQLLYYLVMTNIEKGIISIRYNIKELRWIKSDSEGELRSMADGAKISLGQRYRKFLQDFFPVEYCNIDNQLKSERGLYGVIRSGLTHEYFIKKKSQVVMEVSQPLKCGIIYDLTRSLQLVFVVKQYFEDFKDAFDLYSKKLDSDPTVLKDFGQALRSVNSSLLQQGIPSAFRNNVSGKVYH